MISYLVAGDDLSRWDRKIERIEGAAYKLLQSADSFTIQERDGINVYTNIGGKLYKNSKRVSRLKLGLRNKKYPLPDPHYSLSI